MSTLERYNETTSEWKRDSKMNNSSEKIINRADNESLLSFSTISLSEIHNPDCSWEIFDVAQDLSDLNNKLKEINEKINNNLETLREKQKENERIRNFIKQVEKNPDFFQDTSVITLKAQSNFCSNNCSIA